ncbi:MAG: hypothetical protein ACKOWF_19175 [Chloroflexota bacterium]
MEHQPVVSGEPPSDREGDLRRRLAFYEDFDAIINENVRRSGELLREAERRHAAAAVERERERDLLRSLADEAAALVRQAGALAARIDDALRAIELPALSGSASPAHPVSNLVIHGVGGTPAAARLRDAIAAAPDIASVEVMEFSGGLLRLRIDPAAERPLDLLRAAAGGASVHEIASGPGVVAVRLAQETM